MFDPQMLMSMFGNMNNLNFGNSNGENESNGNNMQNNPLFSMLGANPNMLSGLMQMMNNKSNNSTPNYGKNTYVNNKISDNKSVNLEIYHLIKNAENIY